MITGILFPDEGEIIFNGQPFNPEKDIAYIGYMPEEKGLYKKMKIGDQAMYLAQLKGLSKAEALERVKHWFIKFEMQSWWNKKVEDLSKGMQQKLQFVTTVLNDPKLIILDEPFSGLDPVNSNLIKDEIYKLAQQGSSIIFSTHRMEQVEEICDHIILVNKGQKVLDGSVSAVKHQFKENIFAIGLDSNPTDINTPVFELINTKGNQHVLKINEGYKPNDVLLYFLQQQAGINSFHEILPSLSDIFIKLVEGTPLTRQFQTATA
jgi:ABC-2 type transport system ATP-binding protein